MRWRTIILVLAGLGAPLALLVTMLPITWGYGGYLETQTGPHSAVLSYVDADGPAAKAGLRQGEAVVPASHAEAVFEDSGNVGTVAHIIVAGGNGRTRTVSFAFVPFSGALAVQERLEKLLSALTALGTFVIAILVVLRARERQAGELAALVLVLAGLRAFCQGAAVICDNAWTATLFYWVAPIFFAGAIVWASLRFLAIYPPNPTRVRTLLGKASSVALVWSLLAVFAYAYDLWAGTAILIAIENATAPVDLLLMAALVVAIIDGMVSARSAHATPMRWLGAMWLVATALAAMSSLLPQLVGHNGDLLSAVVVFFLAFGVAYPVLRHRLIDLNILVSRATVFGIASAIIVGVFVVAEWVISRIFERSMGFSSQREDFAAQALTLLVVLVLGISARSIHGFVEERMTKTFFRKRMRGLAEVERVAREADAATDASAMINVAVAAVQRCLEPLGTALYLRDDDGYERTSNAGAFAFPGSFGFNDEPALRLRRWQEPFELDDESEERHHVLFVPMTLRGDVLGFLCCGPKPDHTAYLGDEIAALSLLAHHVGIASALLERQQAIPSIALAPT
jgi:hypothetical protein